MAMGRLVMDCGQMGTSVKACNPACMMVPFGGKRMGGRSGGGGDNQPVRTLGIDEFPIDEDFKLNHLSGTATGEDGIVEGDGAFGGFAFADECGLNQDALFGKVFPF